MGGELFIQAFIYLTAAVIAVPIAQRLGLGSVLGYLLAGIVIGPFVLGLVGSEGADVMHFAEFGVVMMLFVIGLELEPSLLWRLRTPILGLGGLQVLLSLSIFAGIALLLGLSWQMALAVGMILALSSTAIVLQTLNEKGLMASSAGQSSFAVLLFQDIAVIPMLALFPLLATGQNTHGAADEGHGAEATAGHGAEAAAGHGAHAADEAHATVTFVSTLPAWGQTLAVLGAVLIVILIGLYAGRPVFRAIARTRMRELFTAAALLLVIGITLLMTQVGLSPALGAFLAGVVLATSEYRHELESVLEPFKGLLLGLFFMAVGASIDFQLIGSQPLMIVTLVAAVMFIKFSVLFVLSRVFSIGLDQGLWFAVGLSQVGEFAFVLLASAGQLGVLPVSVSSPLTAVVATSMALTPLLITLHERFIQPRVGTRETGDSSRKADAIDEHNPVIIAGFGQFGITVGRLLMLNGIGTTVLDSNSDRVDTLRRVGLKVYYGDATRHDLLAVAGAESAKLVVLALDDDEKNLALAHTLQKHFPHVAIFAQAKEIRGAQELMRAGITHVYRQHLHTALRLGSDAMSMLGVRAYTAQRASQVFAIHDEAMMRDLAFVKSTDRKTYMGEVRQRLTDMEQLLSGDKEDSSEKHLIDAAWDTELVRQERL